MIELESKKTYFLTFYFYTEEIFERTLVWVVFPLPVFSLQSSVEPQNKNNNACVPDDAESGGARPPSRAERRLSGSQEDVPKRDREGRKEKEARTRSQAESSRDLQTRSESRTVIPSSRDRTPVASHCSSSQRALSAGRDGRVQSQSSPVLPPSPHGAITHSATSRFGMRTFTVVPPRPAMLSGPAEAPPHGATVAAVKIDDQGNMVRAGIGHNGAAKRGTGSGDASPPFGKAREFWSSGEKQESHSRGLAERDLPVRSPSTAGTKAPPLRTRPDEQTVRREEKEVPRSLVRAEREEQPQESQQPQGPRKNLPFLKPSRRTSSQYVASAINKYSSTSASPRPGYLPARAPDSSVAPLTASQRPGRLPTDDSDRATASLGRPSGSSSPTSAHPAAPSRSLSVPALGRSDSRTEAGEVWPVRERFGGGRGSSGGITRLLESAKNRQLQSSRVDRLSTAANRDQDPVKLSPPLKPKPTTSSPPPKVTAPGPTIVSPKSL